MKLQVLFLLSLQNHYEGANARKWSVTLGEAQPTEPGYRFTTGIARRNGSKKSRDNL